MKWIFHTIPQAGDFGNETWGKRIVEVVGGSQRPGRT